MASERSIDQFIELLVEAYPEAIDFSEILEDEAEREEVINLLRKGHWVYKTGKTGFRYHIKKEKLDQLKGVKPDNGNKKKKGFFGKLFGS